MEGQIVNVRLDTVLKLSEGQPVLLVFQNRIIGKAETTRPIPYPRNATDEEILNVWERSHHVPPEV